MDNLDNHTHPLSFDKSLAWHESEPLVCTSVVPEAPNVATFSFCAPSGAWFNYKPGQFIQLELATTQGVVQRTYTISSTPSRPRTLSVTVKAQANSIGGRWMLDNLRPGMALTAKGPNGLFVLPDDLSRRYLFISAGSGITPMLAMTRYLVDVGNAPDICFVHCAQRPSDIIARRQIENMAVREPLMSLHYVVEAEDPFSLWTGYRGRLSQPMLDLIAPDFADRDVFCCGPEPFMQAVRSMLESSGYTMKNYQQESFGQPASEASPEVDSPLANSQVSGSANSQVVFSQSGITVECLQSDTILDIAKASGLNIPFGCTMGLCGTCKTFKSAGTVQMNHNGGINAADIDAGYILACCSYPVGVVEIDA